MMYTLYGVPDWGSQVIHMALAELGQPFRFIALNWDAGDFADPGFLKLNPLGLVPTLQTPAGVVFETTAILLYLSENHPGLAPAPRDPDRAAFLTWLIFTTNCLHPDAIALLHPERAGGEAVKQNVADTTHARLRKNLGVLESVAAQGHWWLSPDRPSLVSLYVIMLLRWINAFPAYATHSIASADFPHLHAMAKAMEQRPAILKVMEAEGLSGPAFSNPPCETA